jgi:hypothetical protein
MAIVTSPWPGARPRVWQPDATWFARLSERLLVGLFGAFQVGYFLLMWVVTAYEVAMMLGVPICYPAIQAHAITAEAAEVLYATAARGHTYLLPAVVWFLAYQGLPAIAAMRNRRLAAG